MADLTYNQAYNQLGAAYNPQSQLINQQIGQLDPQLTAQTSALDQAKVNAFKDITDQSNAKGVLFSGVPIDQQSTYLGEKYLPALADLKSTYQNSKNSLVGQLNTLNSQRVQQAQGAVSDFAKNQADANYKNAQLQIQYAKLANSQSAASNKPLTQTQASAAITKNLSSVKGGDGYVAPQDYAQAFKDWTQAGFSAATFNNIFGYLKNPKNGYYGYAISQLR